jgi:hypothetical protein
MGKRLLNRSSSRKIKLKEKINITTKIKQIKFYKRKNYEPDKAYSVLICIWE